MRQCVIAILLACCMALSVFGREEIRLRDHKAKKKRSVEVPLLKAFIDCDSKELSLEFTENLGLLSVTVSDVNGNIVYADAIGGMDNTFVTIALDQEMKGQFILSITNNENEISGEFFIN